jgi:hypothetical protein
MKKVLIISLLSIFSVNYINAQEAATSEDLAKAAQNPIANMISVPWAAGPSLVALAMPGKWVVGGVVSNIWSFAGDEDRSDVNFMTFQPFINYNFPKFYITCSPIITANWEAESGQQWTVPVGAGIGKLVKLGGKLPVNLNANYFYNVVTPDLGPDYQIRLLAAVILPTSIMKKK